MVEANFKFQAPDIAVNSPANGAIYYSSEVSVDLMVILKGNFPYEATFAICQIDGETSINVTFFLVNETGVWSGKGSFNSVSGGSHHLTAEVQIRIYGGYRSDGSRNPDHYNMYNVSSTFYVDLPNPPTPTPTPLPTNPPAIDLSLANRTYDKPVVPLVFNVNDSTSWMGFSLDNQANVTLDGNITLVDLSEGNHTVVVYANDTFGNMGKSDPVSFVVSLPAQTPSPTPLPTPSPSTTQQPTLDPSMTAIIIIDYPSPIGGYILVGLVTLAVIAIAGSAIFLKKRKREHE